MKKIYINESQIQMLNEQLPTPDGVIYNDVELSPSDSDAHAFLVLNGTFCVGPKTSTHTSILWNAVANEMGFNNYVEYRNKITILTVMGKEDDADDLEFDFVQIESKLSKDYLSKVNGRVWVDREIICFWGFRNSKEGIEYAVNKLKEYFNKPFDNLKINYEGELVDYKEFMGLNVDLTNNKEDMDNAYNIHLANQKDKRNALSDFRKNRSKKHSEKLGSMPMAQYHYLTTIGDNVESKETNLNEFFNHEYDNVEIIKLYHGTTLESVNDILESGIISAKHGKQHGETNGVNWFSTNNSLNFYRGALFSIEVPKIDFENYNFNFMNNVEVTCYNDINIVNYNFQLEKVGEFSNLETLKNYLSKSNNDLWEFYNKLITNDHYFNEIEYLDISQPLYIQLFRQLGISDEELRNEGLLVENQVVNENLELEVEPNEVDLSSFKKQNELNPHFWTNGKLNSKIRFNILDIADDFYKSLNIKWMKPIDIILCGSMCNYNWSAYSDVDVHIVIDFNEISDNKEILEDYFNMKKNEWNNEHNELNIHGYNIELYVQDSNADFTSSGIYSLEKDEWLNKPSKNNITDLSDRRQKRISKVVADIMTQIDDLYVNYETYEDDEHELSKISNKIDKLLKNLKNIRKNGLEKNGELSLGNIVYKAIRRADYFDKLWQLKVKIYDKIHSI